MRCLYCFACAGYEQLAWLVAFCSSCPLAGFGSHCSSLTARLSLLGCLKTRMPRLQPSHIQDDCPPSQRRCPSGSVKSMTTADGTKGARVLTSAEESWLDVGERRFMGERVYCIATLVGTKSCRSFHYSTLNLYSTPPPRLLLLMMKSSSLLAVRFRASPPSR